MKQVKKEALLSGVKNDMELTLTAMCWDLIGDVKCSGRQCHFGNSNVNGLCSALVQYRDRILNCKVGSHILSEIIQMIDEGKVVDREALEDMVWQFGYRGVKNKQPVIYTGGLSALEGAFEALRWEDPHYLPDAEGYCCEIEGCVEEDTSGLHWGGFYLRLCSKHAKDCWEGKPLPKVKQWAIDREAKRDKETGVLPFRKVEPLKPEGE